MSEYGSEFYREMIRQLFRWIVILLISSALFFGVIWTWVRILACIFGGECG